MHEISRRFGPVAMAAVFLAAALLLLGETFREDYHLSRASHAMGPAFFPRIVLAGMALLSLVAIVESISSESGGTGLAGAGRVLGLIAITLAYGLSIGWIGFMFASFAFIVAASLALGYRRLAVVLPVAAVYAFSVWFMFEKVLLIVLPSSPWFDF